MNTPRAAAYRCSARERTGTCEACSQAVAVREIVYSTEGDRVCRRCAAATSSAHASEVLSAPPSGPLHYALLVAAPFAALAGLWTLAAASRLVFLGAVVTLWIVRSLFARA